MKIEYFLKDGFLDKRALDGGVYVVDLLKENTRKVIHLYVGEGGCIVKRSGKHLMEFSKDPEYFGIKKEYKNKKNLILRFKVYHKLKEKEPFYDDLYIDFENKVIKKLKPLTQNPESNNDNMIAISKKIEKVEKAMKEKGFV